MPVMSPSGQEHAHKIQADLAHERRDLSEHTRGMRLDRDYEGPNKSERLAQELGREATEHQTKLIDGPPPVGLLPPGHLEEPTDVSPEAEYWRDYREREDRGTNGATDD